jgi:intracellular sulfur oxidation DsrE/DsrF family protein
MTPLVLALVLAAAGPGDFSPGPVITGYGPVAEVPGMSAIESDIQFKVSFDFREAGEDGAPIPGLVTAARFLNMHARAGVAEDRMDLAIVIHGGAVSALAVARNNPGSADAALIAQLIGAGHRIIVCGQSAMYAGVTAEDLPDGIELMLSAMTAHALLQQDGYTLNPF